MDQAAQNHRPPSTIWLWVWLYVSVMIGIAVLAAIPVLSAFTAGAIASFNGCRLDEGSVHPCSVLGIEMGDTLYFMGVLAWLGLATIPLGMIAIGVVAIVMLAHLALLLFRRYRSI
jgi:hypothetical protein